MCPKWAYKNTNNFCIFAEAMNTANNFYERGKEFQQKQQWGDAINAYKQALELDPDSPAAAALEYIYEILAFRHTDIYNP